jgi:hypothetical protein
MTTRSGCRGAGGGGGAAAAAGAAGAGGGAGGGGAHNAIGAAADAADAATAKRRAKVAAARRIVIEDGKPKPARLSLARFDGHDRRDCGRWS